MRLLNVPITLPCLVLTLWPAGPSAGQSGDEEFATTRLVFDSHQIDRFEAIDQLQRLLGQEPDRPIDWVILGELAQEVAFDVPSSQTARYLDLARDAYAQALRLMPDDPGIRAALDVVTDQRAQLDTFQRDREHLISAYLDARRRELSRPGATPMLRDTQDHQRRPRASTQVATHRTRASADDPSVNRSSIEVDRPADSGGHSSARRAVSVDTIEPVVHDDFYQSPSLPSPPLRAGLASPQSRIVPAPPTAPRPSQPFPSPTNRPLADPPQARTDPTDRPAPVVPRSMEGTPPRVPEAAPVLPAPDTPGTSRLIPEGIGTMPTTAPAAPEAANPPPIGPRSRP